MSITRRKVLIVEDDPSVAGSIEAVAKKLGYAVTVTGKPEEALLLVTKERFTIAFIDLLLPQMSGTDLAKKIRQGVSEQELPFVLMSGVFTDKQSIRDAIASTQAKDFLKKPFDISEVFAFLESDQSQGEDGRMGFSVFTLLSRISAFPKDKRKIIEELKKIHGYELPMALSALVEMRYTGQLHMVSEKGEKASIEYVRGHICQVNIVDVQSYVGRLLQSKGYVLGEDLEKVLSTPSQKRLMQRLIDENYMSPHAIDEVLKDQMNLRLAKLVSDHNYTITFVHTDNEDYLGPMILTADFPYMLHEWIASSIPDSWLASQFMRWMDITLRYGPYYRPESPILNLPLMTSVPFLGQKINDMAPVMEMVNHDRMLEFDLYRAVYFLICKGYLVFGEKLIQVSDEDRLVRLNKMASQMRSSNLISVYEIMGGNRDSTPEESIVIYSEFIRALGAPPNSQSLPQLTAIYNEIKSIAEESQKLFLDRDKFFEYENQMEATRATARIQAQSDIEEAKKLLSRNIYAKALEHLERANGFKKIHGYMLYVIWAKVGILEAKPPSKNKKDFAEIDSLNLQVSSEERHTALGNFVMGLTQRIKGDGVSAKKSFETALNMDRNMIEARRELAKVSTENKSAGKDVPFYERDLSSLFKRK